MNFKSKGAGAISLISPNGNFSVQSNGMHKFISQSSNTYFWGNSMNGQEDVNGNGEFWLNYAGYGGGLTQFRDLKIANGKGQIVSFVDGSEKNTQIMGNINQSIGSNSSLNSFYGGMWFHNDTGIPTSLNESYQIINFTNSSHKNGFAFNNNQKLTNTNGVGTYQVSYNVIGQGLQNHEYHACVFVNENCEYNTNNHAIGQASNQITISGFGFIILNPQDNVTIRVKDSSTTPNGLSYNGNVNLVRVGN